MFDQSMIAMACSWRDRAQAPARAARRCRHVPRAGARACRAGADALVSRPMTGLPVQCPACSARYLLPATLLGEAGASVRCPTCTHEFTVDAQGAVVTRGPAGNDLRGVARTVFDELSARVGPALETAARERRLFAEHGPELMQAWDEFRRRAGVHAPSRPFRDELRDRFGVELFPPGSE